jgi:Domain of unknown function (DUF5666)
VRHLAGLFLLSLTMSAQQPITRGRLLESDTSETGELSIRSQNDRVYWFVYDSKTYVERENHLSSVPKLHKGDELEVVCDTGPDAALRYARTIHVLENPAGKVQPQRQFSEGRYAMPRRPAVRDDPLKSDLLFTAGTLTFAGLVSQLNDERLVLRTRTGGEKTIYLRPDTRYMKDGGVAARGALRLNTRVYVRGSKNLEGEIEAFQVIWGEVLEPGLKH